MILGQGRTKTSDGSNRSYGLLHEWTRVLTMMTTGGGAQCCLRGSEMQGVQVAEHAVCQQVTR